jgi:hypothetical protein
VITSELMQLLEIEFAVRGPTRVSGSIAADERHHQPWGLVHGGLYTTAIESFATTGRAGARVSSRVSDFGPLRGVHGTNSAGRPCPAAGSRSPRAAWMPRGTGPMDAAAGGPYSY